jgi:UDP-N-acetylglucosamine enolpyruvyl transferase
MFRPPDGSVRNRSRTSVITETVFESRFHHAEELTKMGARIQIEGQSAIVEGVERTDRRFAASR